MLPPVTVPEDLRLTVVTEAAGPASAVVRVTGDLDPHTAPQLETELQACIERDGLTEVVLDLAGVGFIDSAGLRVLLGVHKLLGQVDGRLVLQSLSGPVQRLLELTRLNDEFEVR